LPLNRAVFDFWIGGEGGLGHAARCDAADDRGTVDAFTAQPPPPAARQPRAASRISSELHGAFVLIDGHNIGVVCHAGLTCGPGDCVGTTGIRG
jgi:hypothetical protein